MIFFRGNFERIKSLRSQLRTDFIKFEIKDYFVNDAEIQESNYINQGAKLKKRFSKIRVWLHNTKTSGGKLKNDPFQPKTASFWKLFIVSFLWNRGDCPKKPSRWPLWNLTNLMKSKPKSQTEVSTTNHPSQNPNGLYSSPRCAFGARIKLITNSPTMVQLLVFSLHQTRSKPKQWSYSSTRLPS